MSDGRPLRVTQRAAREIAEASAWWEANRPEAFDTFRQEIENAFGLIATYPGVGARALNTEPAGVRRVRLSRIRCCLYCRAVMPSEAVEVLALWHTGRGTEPGV